MKVYVVTHGSYNDKTIEGVFTSLEPIHKLYAEGGYDSNGEKHVEVTKPIDRTFDPPRRRFRRVSSDYEYYEFVLDEGLHTGYTDHGDYGWEYFVHDDQTQET